MRASNQDFAAGAPWRDRRAALTFGAVSLLSLWLWATPPSSKAATTTTLTTVADAHVRSDAPNRNYGRGRFLRVGRSPLYQAYLRFDLAGLGQVTSATLRLHTKNALAKNDLARPPIKVRAVRGAGWEEATITFARRPPVGTVVRSARRLRRGRWLSIDVTSAVEGGRTVSLALTSPSPDGLVLTSRESARKPHLDVTWDSLPPEFAVPPAPVFPPPKARPVRRSPASPPAPPAPAPAPPPPTTDPPPPAPDPPPPVDEQPAFPIRAAFYYPWFAEAWTQNGIYPYTRYTPSLGYYSSAASATIRNHISSLEYGKVEAAISSWWGQTSKEDERFPLLLSETSAVESNLRWAPYYENESVADPTSAEIEADLAHIKSRYGSRPAYLRVDGKPVIFVYADSADACGMADRWQQANAGQGFHVVLKVFPGFQSCASQPSGWHQYAPAAATQHVSGHSYSVSPGFWKADEPAARLERNATRFGENVRDMVASGEPWQLITTFNEWGEGTSVESASQWAACSSCTGVYLNYLRRDGLPPGSTDPVVAAAGDIACNSSSGEFNGGSGTANACRQLYTSDLLVGHNLAAVLVLGDLQYEDALLGDFTASYDLSWGRIKSITYPVAGNHEYKTAGAAGYFDYFNGQGNQTGRAGDRDKGYYSFDVGSWHLISLNSNCWAVGGCHAGSPQEQWLRSDLAAHPRSCTLAFWHHPRFASGFYGNNSTYEAFWQALHDHGADVVLNGHDHNYQRYAPQTPAGAADPNGIREFIVGTGGKSRYPVDPNPVANREAANQTTYGVLKLTLHPHGYDWRFQPELGGSFSDVGSASCH